MTRRFRACPVDCPRPRKAALLSLPALLLILLAPAGEGAMGMPEHPPKTNQAYGSGKVLKPEFDDLVRHADLIVTGKVIKIGSISHPGPSKNRPSSKRYTYWESSYAILEVESTIKGKTPKAALKVAFHSDLEEDKTNYRVGTKYIAFLSRPSKYPDAYTTTHFHYGEYTIDDQGRALRMADTADISKPSTVVIERIHKAMGSQGKSR